MGGFANRQWMKSTQKYLAKTEIFTDQLLIVTSAKLNEYT